jgi:hypothetical protein
LLASVACRQPSDAGDAGDAEDAEGCLTNDARVCVPASVLAELEAGNLQCGGLCGADVVTLACRPDDVSASSSDGAQGSSGADDPQCGDLAALICTFGSESCREGG